MWDSILTLIGRFHPIIIHLPIGFIIIGLLIELSRKKFKESKNILIFIFSWGTISCILSIISGFLQYLQEGLLWESIDRHFYFGILTLLFTFGFYQYLKGKNFFSSLPRRLYTVGLVLTVTITGHLGGQITHGDQYLTEPFQIMMDGELSNEETLLSSSNASEGPIFNSLIQPILNSKCISCHNSEKSKGGLALHNFESLQRGSKNGMIINYENPELSEIFVRIHLPKNEKKHMPPKSKKQLTKAEISILSHWINAGAPENILIKDMKISNELLSNFIKKKERFFPEIEISSPNNKSISFLRGKGVHIAPISKSSNLLYLSSYNYHDFMEEDIFELKKLSNNIVDIDLSNSSFNDEVFEMLSAFTNLTRLKLNYTSITGKGLDQLSSLKNLKIIHLVNTDINSSSIKIINSFPYIEKAYLFQNNRNLSKEINLSDEDLKKFDFGEYITQGLTTDE
ncbi:MAG: hypothetical protein CMC57_01235 [Flavobacteriaceae bacterium]|nr:hypothetical protein [Flavobacteriaceae bacterium]